MPGAEGDSVLGHRLSTCEAWLPGPVLIPTCPDKGIYSQSCTYFSFSISFLFGFGLRRQGSLCSSGTYSVDQAGLQLTVPGAGVCASPMPSLTLTFLIVFFFFLR